MNLLEIKNISLKFGGLKAVDNVTLRVDQGEVVSLIGPNGGENHNLQYPYRHLQG